jgi:tetratricopeptide (TPR) repeat protein
MPKMPLPQQKPSPFGFNPEVTAAPPSIKLNHDARKQLLILLQRGMEMQRAGNFIEAERFYQMVLQRAPDMPEANNLMGTIAMEAEDYPVAVEFLEKAVAGLPKDPLIRHNIASALISLHDFHAALTHLRKALNLKPGQVESLALTATCYNRMSRSAEGLPFAERALRMSPDNAEARSAYAEALINLGRMDDAEKELKTAITTKLSVPRSYQSLSSVRKFSAGAPELEALRHEIDNPDYSEKELSPLHYAAAKMCSDAKLYDEAMAHYLKAKAASAATYDINAYEKRVDHLIALFNPFFLSTRKNFGDPSQKPVFIVGMPRSGTTLTEQIISSHAQVAGAGELGEMASIARTIGDNPRMPERSAASMTSLSEAESKQYAQRYLKFIARTSHEAARVTDKMPHNFEQLGLIALLFPNATIIHCKRDAIDNCLSCYMNAFSEAHAYNTDLTKLGRYYRAYNKLMTHWHKVLPGRVFDNQYETLVADQEGQTRKLIEHCKLPWDEACLNYTENERSVTTISRWQVRQPIYRSSMKRWKPYEKHLGPLIEALGDLAEV